MLAVEPLLPLWLLAIPMLMALLAAAVQVVRGRWLAGGLRLLAAALVGLVALSPMQRNEVRTLLADQALAVIDRSGSMGFDTRGRMAEAALAKLVAQHPEGLSWRVEGTRTGAGDGDGAAASTGTRLAETLERGLARMPADRLAGVVVISDGLAHDGADLAALRTLGRPVHLLLAGDPDLPDRRLTLTSAPDFGLVGTTAMIGVRLDGPGAADLRWSVNGRAQRAVPLAAGQTTQLRVRLDRRGPHRIELEVPALAGEKVTANNFASLSINAVRERLNVLLVSGVPYLGGRLWRDVLKGDGSIDLMHFTILRLPTSLDPTPVDEMALIPFPVDQLFGEHLSRFDLIILDRFGSLELLPDYYFDNMVRFVQQGGGLLVTAGPEFARAYTLSSTALDGILPVRPTGKVSRLPYRLALTDTGRRHPVTAALLAQWSGAGGSRPWGQWDEQIDADARSGLVLAQGAGNRPLLVLAHEQKGRVATLLSDQLWLWARGVDGGGPRDALLKRLIHWLMQEPELNEEQIALEAQGAQGVVSRQTLSRDVMSAQLRLPDGSTRRVDLPLAETGWRTARFALTAPGRYTVEAGGRTAAMVWQGADPLENLDVVPTASRLAPLVAATGGAVHGLERGLPALRRIAPGTRAGGGDWIGLVRNNAGRLLAVERRPLIPPVPGLLLALGALLAAWAVERR